MREEDFQEIMRIQQQMSQRIMQERHVDHKIDVLNVVNDLTENGRKRTQVEAVLIEAAMNDIPEDEAVVLLDELEQDHLVRRTRGGMIERI